MALGTSGCAMLSTQATMIPYSPSDGVNIPDSGPLQVRNVLVVSDEEGVDGNLVAAIVNALFPAACAAEEEPGFAGVAAGTAEGGNE